LIKIAKYVKAETLQEAYELNQKKPNLILGGMLWLKMQNRNVNTAIDLSGLGLDQIEETSDHYLIGAMVTLRQLECHEGLHALTGGSIRESVRHIVGVQFRNLATVGGSIFGRYGFSDVLTCFMALGAKVELYKAGIVSVEEFARMPRDRDILVRLILPKEKQEVVYLSQRNTRTDFPVLTCCTSVSESEVRCVIGARPMRAICLRDEEQILSGGITPESAEQFADYIKATVRTGSNLRGSSEYRRILAGVLSKRSLLTILDNRNEVPGNAD
jgi:CO/xanthine dehydrogenase FAD-binding subunit